MKMELTAALLHSPEVLFLDEPTIGLDVVAQHNIQIFLKDYQQQRGVTILLTSHYMKDVAALCRRVVIIAKGQIMYDGSLTTPPASEGVRWFVCADPVSLSRHQIDVLKGLYCHNNRPVQPAYARVVLTPR